MLSYPPDWSRSHPRVSPPTAESLGAHVSRDEVAVAHPTGAAQEVCQTVSDTRGCVTRALLLASTQTRPDFRTHSPVIHLQQSLDYFHALYSLVYISYKQRLCILNPLLTAHIHRCHFRRLTCRNLHALDVYL